MTAGDALLPQCTPALSAGAALSARDAAAPAAHERLRACVGGDLRRTNASAKVQAGGSNRAARPSARLNSSGARTPEPRPQRRMAAALPTAHSQRPVRPRARLTWAVFRSWTQQSARTHIASGRFGCFFFQPCLMQTGPLCAARPQTVLPFRSVCREPSSEPQVCFRRGAGLYANVRRADGILPLSVRDAAQAAVP